MATSDHDAYRCLDRPDILQAVFHPRPAFSADGGDHAVHIPVADGVTIGSRFHTTAAHAPTILFFHGNGEIVPDYDDLGPLYNNIGINFAVVDYRGYGHSTGHPTVSDMMADCHEIFTFTRKRLSAEKITGPLFVMGRSLGSASALEVAVTHHDDIAGLIIESGFARVGPLLQLLGVDTKGLDLDEQDAFRHLDKIGRVTLPTLVIHAEHDHIIPFAEGQDLYRASGAADKSFLEVPGANHNDILMRGFSEYFGAISRMVNRAE